MSEICAWRIIREARNLKRTVNFSIDEIEFLAKCKDISDGAKCLWLILAAFTCDDPHLACSISLDQLASKVNKSCFEIYDMLRQLTAMGFIHIDRNISIEQCNERCSISLSFPLEGLLVLKKAPKIKDDVQQNRGHGKYRRPPILINLLKNNRSMENVGSKSSRI